MKKAHFFSSAVILKKNKKLNRKKFFLGKMQLWGRKQLGKKTSELISFYFYQKFGQPIKKIFVGQFLKGEKKILQKKTKEIYPIGPCFSPFVGGQIF